VRIRNNAGRDSTIMKLIIQLPCFNEQDSLPVTLACLPRTVEGFDSVEWLVVDDGSSDATSAVARSLGVDHVVAHAANLGLARAFMTGIRAALERGADVIVNTDADNQYNADDIPMLIKPIREGKAEFVIGTRPISRMPRFAPVSRFLHALGCLVVRLASGTDIPDAPSGFRAFTRAAAERLNVHDTYTYTLETIIQAGSLNMAITSVPVRVNGQLRPSRLISSIPSYILKSARTIIRTFALYRPRQFFVSAAIALLAPGALIRSWSNGIGALLLGLGGVLVVCAYAIELLPARKRIRDDAERQAGKVERSGQPSS